MIRIACPPARGRSRQRLGLCLGLAWALLLAGGAAVQGVEQPAGAPASERSVVRIGFSAAMFSDVNENDAKAAVRIWAQTIARERHIETDPDPLILGGLAELDAALRQKQIDLVTVLTEEYRALEPSFPFAPIFIAHVNGRTAEECILVVHRDSGIAGLEDLGGRSLITYNNPRASLAIPWLDTLLLEKGFLPAAEFLGRVSGNNKLARVVLPVFFRQSDACLVTRSGFDTMTELNPQLGRALTVLVSSQNMVPVLLCFRADYASSFKDKVLQGLRELHLSPTGRQLLTMFHSEKLEEMPPSALQNALDLLARHEKLRQKAGGRPEDGEKE